jgi:MFS family permease
MNAKETWDTSYEWKTVTLLGIGFGLVGLDRWIITPLFPVMMKDLNLNYQDLGSVVAILGITWGLFAIIFGGLSDKLGRRKILISSMVIFSLLSGLTGVAAGLASLLIIRAVMGVFEGAYTPVSVAAVADASKPSRRGLNLGIYQSLFALLGLGLGPIIATQLLNVVPSWHWVFVLVSIPGLIIAYLLARVIREPAHILQKKEEKQRWMEIFRYRNVILSTIGLIGAMTGIFVLSAIVPNYLTDFLKLSISDMGFVTSAIGFGGFVGYIVIPGLSDRFGRKTVIIFSFIAAIVVLSIFVNTGNSLAWLFIWLFLTTLCVLGSLAIMTGPLTAEAVPPALIASAAGIPIGIGEIFGGGVMPGIAGFVAQHFGIERTLYLAIGGLCLSLVVCLFMKETAPIKTKKLIAESNDFQVG